MEAVEDFMVRVPAEFVFVVYEAGVDVLSLDEFRQHGVFFLYHDEFRFDGGKGILFLRTTQIFFLFFLRGKGEVCCNMDNKLW